MAELVSATELISTKPAKNYERVGSVPISTAEEIKEKVSKARAVKKEWKELGVKKRLETIRPLYDRFDQKKEEIAWLITRETGKPIRESLGGMPYHFKYFKWFLENAEEALADKITYQDENTLHRIVFEPIGVAAVIVPWNFPFVNVIWGTIPNLLAGNPVVFKHSEECPLVGKLCEEIILSANLPEGVFSEVYGDGAVGKLLVEQDIDLIWFTGSSATGKLLYETASKKFIKAVLEMGGSNPAIIFEDMDADYLLKNLYYKRFLNSGQVCDAAKRLIIHESIADEVVEKLKEFVESRTIGDPEDEETILGSMVSKRQVELIASQVQDAVDKGAAVVAGGKQPEGLEGAYYEPTILTNVTRDMRVWKEETFGPVLPVLTFKTEEEAVELANDTPYGLGAFVYTNDRERALRVASRIEAGTVEVNKANHFKACNPYGGYKVSGIGKEHGVEGLRELCQLKVITI